MRCSCERCGTYMVQRERGTDSACVCPACFFECRACMGGENRAADMIQKTNGEIRIPKHIKDCVEEE